jgi:hypothetical protein
MTIVLSERELYALEFLYVMYERDSNNHASNSYWGGCLQHEDAMKSLKEMGLVFGNPENEWFSVITQKGADYLRVDVKIVTPFDIDELTAARAEIARLTAALAESEAARKVADAGWSEAIDQIDELTQEIKLLKQDSGIPF